MKENQGQKKACNVRNMRIYTLIKSVKTLRSLCSKVSLFVIRLENNKKKLHVVYSLLHFFPAFSSPQKDIILVIRLVGHMLLGCICMGNWPISKNHEMLFLTLPYIHSDASSCLHCLTGWPFALMYPLI